ncbi:TPA: efflux transporter periplasmic adaptor subunit, partial [Stenotrophomonas maltophilia]
VEHGLAAGDKVIIDGVQKVFMPGMPVQAKAVAMQPQPAPAPGRDATAALKH